MSLSAVTPFYTSLPAGYREVAVPSGGTAASTSQAANPQDTVNLRTSLPGRTITAEAGDQFSLNVLYDAGPGGWDDGMRYRVALREDPAQPAGAKLLLNGVDVAGRTDFTAMEFNNLLFEAGPSGAKTDLVVVARKGTPDGAGGITAFLDSPALQLTVATTGTRSINAAPALRTLAGPDEADFLRIAREASMFAGFGNRPRPELKTVGSFTAEAGDQFSLNELYDAGPGAWDGVAQYRVALREDPAQPSGARDLPP